MIRDVIRLLRPLHWFKNLFVLAPMLFAVRLFDPVALPRALLTLAAFCLTSSAVYALNDIVDRDRDRACPMKRDRPVASGALTPRAAGFAAACCAVSAAALGALLPAAVAGILGGYVVLNLIYIFRVKRLVIVDVIFIAAGFVLRIHAGAAAVAVPCSPWMALTTFFLSLFLGFTKRRAELVAASEGSAREVLGEYAEPLLTILIAINAGLTILTYALSVIQPSVTGHFGSETLLYTVPIVVYGMLRYLHLSLHLGRGGDVAGIVLRDIPLLVTVLVWGAVVVILVALNV